MTAVFLVPHELIADLDRGARITVGGDEGHHGANARRLLTGETVMLADGNGRRVTGTVADVGKGSFVVQLVEVTHEPRAVPSITVVQAVAKGARAESAVEMLTECGVDAIVPWEAARSVAVWHGDRRERGVRRWRAVARAATKQSRRAWLPAVADLAGTEEVVALLAGADLALVLHERAAVRLAHVAAPKTGTVVMVVGPEGGITDDEIARFTAVRALPVRLGTSILRTSTAGVAAASVLLAASGRWD